MTLMRLYITFAVEISVLMALIWGITRLGYFMGLFFGCVLVFPFFGYYANYTCKTNPVFFKYKFVVLVLTYVERGLAYAIHYLPWVIAGVLVLGLILRLVLVRFNEWTFRFKKRLFASGQKNVGKEFINIEKYLVNDSRYFIGVGKEPVYLEPEDLTTHMQVVGPSGVGKTVSSLFPLAVQTMMKGYPLIFVDGKGDGKLKSMFVSFCKNKNIPMKCFDPLQPDYSSTYNPLYGSTDANELTNILAVGLNLNAPGEAKVYTDIQKKFLSTLLHIFVQTGQKFCFTDVVEFINHAASRDIVYEYIKDAFYQEEMEVFLRKLSKNEKELIGLTVVLDQWFVLDDKISGIINTYKPDIDVQQIMETGGAVLFSFSAGMKAQTNEALAKMVLADISNAVGHRHIDQDKPNKFCMIILDEFGQYVSDSFDKFISTARSANVSCVLSHQTNAQLETFQSKDRLARVVRENTAAKIVFRQSEEASFWSETFGTRLAIKRTDQVETGALMTEKISNMGSLREVDEFIIHPNKLRKLGVGQAVFKFSEADPEIMNFGMFDLDTSARIERIDHLQGEGLNLRKKRLEKRQAAKILQSDKGAVPGQGAVVKNKPTIS